MPGPQRQLTFVSATTVTGSSVGVGVTVAVSIAVGDSVGVGLSVAVGDGVGEAVLVGVGVSVGVDVMVAVKVEVAVGLGVMLGVWVGVLVSVGWRASPDTGRLHAKRKTSQKSTIERFMMMNSLYEIYVQVNKVKDPANDADDLLAADNCQNHPSRLK